MYVSMKEICDKAYAGKYGVPAVIGNSESCVRAAIEAAEETNSPVIILGDNRFQYDPLFYGFMVRHIANTAAIPVAMCLDHSPSFEDAMSGIQSGYSAVMVDRSMLPYEENVRQVKEIVKIAHAVGVTVEAELGHVGMGDNYAVDGNTALTDPDQALEYIQETGVDCLAVAIGTAHGAYKGVPKLRFDLLEEINKKCNTPLVLHGGSGSGDENIHRACSMGITKVNIVNDLMQAAVRGVMSTDMSGNAAYGFFNVAYGAMKEAIKHCFDITGCTGKAWHQVPHLGKPPAPPKGQMH